MATPTPTIHWPIPTCRGSSARTSLVDSDSDWSQLRIPTREPLHLPIKRWTRPTGRCKSCFCDKGSPRETGYILKAGFMERRKRKAEWLPSVLPSALLAFGLVVLGQAQGSQPQTANSGDKDASSKSSPPEQP